eukprot:bmy_20354T0
MTPGSMKKIFSPDDIEQVSSKDDTKTSLKTVVKETSYLMMMQGMSRILAHPLRVITIAARSIFAYLVDDSFSQALAIHPKLPHGGGSGMPTYPFLLVGDPMAAGRAPHSLPRVQIRIHCWKDLSGQGEPFRGSSLPLHHQREKERLEEIMVDSDEISGANFERFLKLFIIEETLKEEEEEEREGEEEGEEEETCS